MTATTASPAPTTDRVAEFDGLRGIAAFAVLVAHVFAPIFQGGEWADNPVAQAVWFSPLHFIDGSVAVYIFFALSGYVLARMAKAPDFAFGRWVPSRVARLMVPILAAIALNLAVILLLRLLPVFDPQRVDAFVPPRPSAGQVAQDATVIFGSSGTLGPLWTMQWELIFSLLLPLFVLFAVRLPLPVILVGGVVLSAVAMFVTTAYGSLGTPAVRLAVYMPMFLLGVGLATHDADARTARIWATLKPMPRRLIGAALTLVVLLLLSAKWFLISGLPLELAWNRAIDLALVLPGVILTLIVVRRVGVVSAIMSSRPAQWLGRISFSLYLTHVPFWIATITIVGQSIPTAFLAVGVALLGGHLFSVVIERRAHRWARRLYRGKAPAPVPAPAAGA